MRRAVEFQLMRFPTAQTWLLSLGSGILQIAIFPFAGPAGPLAAPLAWIALTPLLMALLQRRPLETPFTIREGAMVGYLCGVVWYAGTCSWIYQTMYLYGGLPKPIALLILLLFALYLGLYHALFGAFVVWVCRSRMGHAGALLLAPFGWVAMEFARSRVTGFPWNPLGNSQVSNDLLTQLAPYAGVMSISFVVAMVNAALAAPFLLKGRASFLVATAALLFAVGIEFSGRTSHPLPLAPGSAMAVMLQENLEVGAVGREAAPIRERDELPLFTGLTEHAAIADKRTPWPLPGFVPTVVIWPEAPSHLRSDQPALRQAIGELARAMHAPAIIGSLGVDFSETSSRGYFLYDSASLFDAAGDYQGRYDKIHLVPWGEYIPFKRFFSFAHKLTEGAGDMDRGTRRTIFNTGGHRYGVFICYESIFADEVREFAKDGAEVLVNISDDGWYGDTGAPWQHLNMTRMRAIENDRWVLLDTNTGITTVIDPQGRARVEAPRHVRGAFAFPFEFRRGTTFYTRHGDWFAWLCSIVCAGAMVGGTRFGGTRRSSSRI